MCTILEEIPSHKNLHKYFVKHVIILNKNDIRDCIQEFNSRNALTWNSEYCHRDLYLDSPHFLAMAELHETTVQSLCTDP